MKAKVKSVYFNHPSQGNSTNYYLILDLRDKAAPPTKNLATPSSIFIFIFSSSTGGLCSQPIRGNVRRIGRMFPEHVERSFLDLEYSFDEYFQLGSRRKIRPIKNQLGSRTNIRPIKNGLKAATERSQSLSLSQCEVLHFEACVCVCVRACVRVSVCAFS